VDVRIIAATHRDLLQLATEGKFREDLYYRLKVVHLRIPPLRDRLEDITLLARHFLGEYSKRFGIGPFQLTPALLDRLTAYDWPGNVRELENAIESAVVLARDELDVSLFPPPGSRAVPNAATTVPEAATASTPELNARVDAYERGLIVQALQANRNNRSHTARALGLGRTTLLSKLKKTAPAGEGADGRRRHGVAAQPELKWREIKLQGRSRRSVMLEWLPDLCFPRTRSSSDDSLAARSRTRTGRKRPPGDVVGQPQHAPRQLRIRRVK
jgi:sigma54-dependent transcription regulator